MLESGSIQEYGLRNRKKRGCCFFKEQKGEARPLLDSNLMKLDTFKNLVQDNANTSKAKTIRSSIYLVMGGFATYYNYAFAGDFAKEFGEDIFKLKPKATEQFKEAAAIINYVANLGVSLESLTKVDTMFEDFIKGRKEVKRTKDQKNLFTLVVILSLVTPLTAIDLTLDSTKTWSTWLRAVTLATVFVTQTAQAMRGLTNLVKVEAKTETSAQFVRHELLKYLNAVLDEDKQLNDDELKALSQGQMYLRKRPILQKRLCSGIAHLVVSPYVWSAYVAADSAIPTIISIFKHFGIDITLGKYTALYDALVSCRGATAILASVCKQLLLGSAVSGVLSKVCDATLNTRILAPKKVDGKIVRIDGSALPAWYSFSTFIISVLANLLSIMGAAGVVKDKLQLGNLISLLIGALGAYCINASDTFSTLISWSETLGIKLPAKFGAKSGQFEATYGLNIETYIVKRMFEISQMSAANAILRYTIQGQRSMLLDGKDLEAPLPTDADRVFNSFYHGGKPEEYYIGGTKFRDFKNNCDKLAELTEKDFNDFKSRETGKPGGTEEAIYASYPSLDT